MRLSKRREHLSPNYLCYEINDSVDIRSLITEIYDKQFKRFKEKEYLVIEFVKFKESNHKLIRLHSDMYNLIDLKYRKMLSQSEIDKEYRNELLNLTNNKARYIELETRTDFALPYLPLKVSKKKIDGINDIQICLRPVKNSWKKDLAKLQEGLVSGYDETLRWNGCIGGFVGVFYPLVKLREMSKSEKTVNKGENYEIKFPKPRFENQKFEDKYKLIEKKKSNIGFDITIKLVLSQNEFEKTLVELFNALNTNISETSNSFVIKENIRFGSFNRNKIIKAYTPEKSLDLLNENEITEVINRLII